VYWPRERTVTVERNVYFNDSASAEGGFEGENAEDFNVSSETPSALHESRTETKSEDPQLQTLLTYLKPPKPKLNLPLHPHDASPVQHPQCDRKPSRYARDLMSGEGRSSSKPGDPNIPVGLQVPTCSVTIQEVPDEGDEAGGVEYALVAETSEAEALDPRDLREARRRPDWPR
ncbi:hypothetical protein NEOLEDRAFT_1041462, partial [Neolentinus lepideus HHB14362 ss-1]